VLLGPLHERLPAPGSVVERGEEDGMALLPAGETPAGLPVETGGRGDDADVATLLARRASWARERGDLLARATLPAPATSPSALEQVDEEVRVGGAGAPPGRADALALGAAVHRIMELADLADPDSPSRLAEPVCAGLGRPDLTGRAAGLATACWQAAAVRAAAAAPEVYRELPVGVLVDDVVVTGAVDLLYGDGDEWVVVDYKTDRSDAEASLRERYTPQGAAYALAVEAATGGVVREVVFVAAAAGREIRVPVTGELRRAARERITASGVSRLRPGDVLE
jgi:hypothetical protein